MEKTCKLLPEKILFRSTCCNFQFSFVAVGNGTVIVLVLGHGLKTDDESYHDR